MLSWCQYLKRQQMVNSDWLLTSMTYYEQAVLQQTAYFSTLIMYSLARQTWRGAGASSLSLVSLLNKYYQNTTAAMHNNS